MFIDFLKDYMDHIRAIELSFYVNVDASTCINAIKGFFLHSVSLSFKYIVTFQWMRDLIELPILAKETFSLIINQHTVFEPWKESVTLEPNFYSVNDQPNNYTGIITGFFNGLVVALPCSVGHIYAIRLWLINGRQTGIAGISGLLFGQFLFFAAVLLGFESLITPFLNYEIVILVFGMLFLGFVILDMISQSDYYILDFQNQNHYLLKSFVVAFILGWLEKGCIFTFLGDITVTHSNHILQGASNNFFFGNVLYLVGLIVGSVCWTAVLGFMFFKLMSFLQQLMAKVRPDVIFIQRQKITNIIFTFILTVFWCNSVPYYGLDYLITGPLGFLYQDRSTEVARSKPYYLMFAATQIHKSDPSTGAPLRKLDDPYDGFLYGGTTFDDEFWMPYFGLELSLDVDCYKHLFEQDIQNLETADYMDLDEAREQLARENKEKYKIETYDYQVEVENDIKKLRVPNRSLLGNYHNLEAGDSGLILDAENHLLTPLTLRKQVHMESFLDKVFRPDSRCKQMDFVTALPYDTFLDDLEDVQEARTDHEFRDRYTHNALYRILSKINFHLIISGGQLPSTKLTDEDELNLARSRAILHRYVNSIRTYRKAMAQRTMVEKVYNQQFKGDIHYLRRFDEITLDYNRFELFLGQLNENKGKKVVKYDIPKYNERQNENSVFLHEELSKHYDQQRKSDIKTIRKEPLKYLLKKKIYGIPVSDDIRKRQAVGRITANKIQKWNNKKLTLALKKRTDMIYQRLLVLNDTAPLYIGWDNQLHKFLIKTPKLPTKFNAANITDPVDPGLYDNTDLSEDELFEQQNTSISDPNLQNQVPSATSPDLDLQNQVPAATSPDLDLQTQTSTDKKPKYYHIEAWSPAIKNAQVASTQRIFKLPFLNLTKKEEIDIRRLTDLVPKSLSFAQLNANRDPRSKAKPKQESAYHTFKWSLEPKVFERFPNYNWYWLEFDPIPPIDEPEEAKLVFPEKARCFRSLNLTDVLPPQLDGFAWPGVMDPGISLLFQDNLREQYTDVLYSLVYLTD